jgi:hypothetical protein
MQASQEHRGTGGPGHPEGTTYNLLSHIYTLVALMASEFWRDSAFTFGALKSHVASSIGGSLRCQRHSKQEAWALRPSPNSPHDRYILPTGQRFDPRQ